MDVIEEYLDSLREIYTVEVGAQLLKCTKIIPHSRSQAYDLFRHNCNNFSNDFAMFLLGKGIPEHIINMPQAVL
jgi:PPPDE putative peptidase domain.